MPPGDLIIECASTDGSEAGDRVTLEGSTGSTEFPKVLKSDAWRKMAALLKVQGLRATFDGKPLVTARGSLTLAEGMPDGADVS